MTSGLRQLGALCLSGALLAVAIPAHAYRTVRQLPQFSGIQQARVTWRPGPIAFTVWFQPGLSYLPHDAAFAASMLDYAGLRCTSRQLLHGGAIAQSPVLGDGYSTISYYGDRWTTELGLAADTMATTDLSYRQNDTGEWEIVEADILVNVAAFQLTYLEAITGKRGVSIAGDLIASRGLPGATKPASA